MKIGYACINNSIDLKANKTFRLANYSTTKIAETIKNNLDALEQILIYNAKHNFLFFRISSDIIPFASHPVCTYKWQKHFKDKFDHLANIIHKNDMRISMHPGQYTVINSPKEHTVKSSIRELEYHCDVLDLLKLDQKAKIQIHVGGVYGDKPTAIERFIKNYNKLNKRIRSRLAIEHDDKSFNIKDCLIIHDKTGIPIIFDNLHHECLNNNKSIKQALLECINTWQKVDGRPIIDYCQQQQNAIKGKHAQTLNEKLFKKFLKTIEGIDVDIMLEIKDKEVSAHKAFTIAKLYL